MTDDRVDAALLDELATLLAADHEPPPDVLRAARETFTWRTVDAELAALVHDSLLDDAVGVRAAARSRILTFDADGLTIEVEVDGAPGGRRLLGQLVPGQVAEVELLVDDRTVATATADALGRFAMALPGEPRRVVVRCRLSGSRTVDSAPTVV